MSIENKPVVNGNFGPKVSWKLYLSKELPLEELCTSVFCVVITEDGKVLLMEDEDRGWGLIGGHIDPGENIMQALYREANGEAGLKPKNPKVFAYSEITATEPIAHQDQNKNYPFPTSYMVYYICGIEGEIGQPTEPDSLGSKMFTMEEIQQLRVPDFPIIKLAYDAHMEPRQAIE
jgi:ADP-ribose pyrophosphatase YjhB (NUDIX family)